MASSPVTAPPIQTNSSSLNSTSTNSSSSPPPSPPATSAPPPSSPSPPPPSPPSPSPPTTSAPPPSSPGGSSPPSPPSPPPSQPSPTLPSPTKPLPSSNFAPPPPPRRSAKTPPASDRPPSSDDGNADSRKSSGGSDFNLPLVAGVVAGIALFILQIARTLEGDSSLDDLNEGLRPGQSMLFSPSSDFDSSSYASNMSRLRRVAFESNDISQEYSGRTSDYGLNPSTSSSSGEMKDIGPRSHRPGRAIRKAKTRSFDGAVDVS